MEHDYQYVTKKEANKVRDSLIELINEVQDEIRNCFTFQYHFIGSSSRNMITYDAKGNQGYDFDVNCEIHDDIEEYSPKEIRNILRKAFDRIAWKYGYDYCEDSTRVLTIKFKDRENSRIIHSCDIAAVYTYTNDEGEECQQYIRYNKNQGSYTWEDQPKGYCHLEERATWLRKNGCWDELLDRYIEKKDNNTNKDKHSRSLYAEAVNEIYKRNKMRE